MVQSQNMNIVKVLAQDAMKEAIKVIKLAGKWMPEDKMEKQLE